MSIKIALAGNPNCGKTTLFNALTGSKQFVGNWPGVTVEKKEGKLKENKDVIITDLPGIYSLSPYTLEEVVARDYLVDERPDAILNIVDGTNLERNLYLSTQLIEMGIPVVMAVNMMDIVNKNGDKISIEKLADKLGCPVVEISALKGIGIKEAADMAVKAAKGSTNFEVNHSFSKDVEEIISSVSSKIIGKVPFGQERFFAIKLLEKDDKLEKHMTGSIDVSNEISMLEEKFDDDTESVITNERYEYITSIISDCINKADTKENLTTSDKIDRIITNRILALPIFAVVMFIVYYLSISTVGTACTDWVNDCVFGDGFHLFGMGNAEYGEATDEWAGENVFTEKLQIIIDEAEGKGIVGYDDVASAVEDADFGSFEEAYGTYGDEFAEKGYDLAEVLPLNDNGEFEGAPAPEDYGTWIPSIPALATKGLEKIGCAEWLKGLVVDGIIGGVGAVLGFVPQMLVLFILLALLEACGYMARVAFIMDIIFRKFGLSGKAFIPILIGTGCGVPGIMATRTIENDRDRKMSIMTTTFIPCGAKTPIIALIAAALFNGSAWVATSCYFIGIAAIICSGIILKKTKIFSGDPAPFVMELPAYHMPTVGNVLRSMWQRGWSFIKKAGTIIVLSSIIIWAGSVFGWVDGSFGFDPDTELEESVLGKFGDAIRFVFVPLGFDSIKATIATIMGLVAKEEVVGVFGVLDFEGLTKLSGYSFLVFNLLCAPCFAAMGAIKREMNNTKWLFIAVGYQTVLAYLVSLCIFQIGTLVTGGAFSIWMVVAFAIIAAFIYLLFRPANKTEMLKL